LVKLADLANVGRIPPRGAIGWFSRATKMSARRRDGGCGAGVRNHDEFESAASVLQWCSVTRKIAAWWRSQRSMAAALARSVAGGVCRR